jgi:hypothetical protein
MWIIKKTDFILSSFFSKQFYLNACYKWKKYALPYLFLLSFIVVLPNIYAQVKILSQINLPYLDSQESKYNNNFNVFLNQIITQIPTITVKNQQLSADKDNIQILMPSDNSKILIDIKLQEDYLHQLINAPINIFKNAVIVHVNEYKKTFYISQIFSSEDEQVFNQHLITQYIMSFKNIMLWFVPTIGLLFSIIMTAAIIGAKSVFFMIIMNYFFNKNNITLDYQNIFRLVLAAVTPVIILDFLINIIPISYKIEMFLSFIVIFIGYIYLIKSWLLIINYEKAKKNKKRITNNKL